MAYDIGHIQSAMYPCLSWIIHFPIVVCLVSMLAREGFAVGMIISVHYLT